MKKLLALTTLLAIGACAPATTTAPNPVGPDRLQRPDPPVETPDEPDEPDVPDEAALRASLEARRALQIERLRAYREQGIFPRNTYRDTVVNVLVDDDGTLCAVANLIALDGKRDLVMETAETNRFVRFADLREGPLHDWIFTSGFTREELAAIQLPDSPVESGFEFERRERRRLVEHLLEMERQLLANSDRSIDLIVARLLARPDLHPSARAAG